MEPLGAHAGGLLLDVEGTTTPVRFVYETLLPYARARLPAFLATRAHEGDAHEDLDRLRAEHTADRSRGLAPPEWRELDAPGSAVAYLHWLMDGDRKSTGLKALQGRIWREGYGSGALRGEVYDDVPLAFERWRRQGKQIAIFSSGSVLAQRLLFANTSAGDLTSHIRDYFDTTTGPKRDPESYRRISSRLGLPPGQILFLSDAAAELDAASQAGLNTALCVREPGNAPTSAHPVVASFDAVSP